MDYRGLPRPSSAPGAKASTVCHTHLTTTETRCSRTLSTNQTTTPTPPQHSTQAPTAHDPCLHQAGRTTTPQQPPTTRKSPHKEQLRPQTPNSAYPLLSHPQNTALPCSTTVTCSTPHGQRPLTSCRSRPHPPTGGSINQPQSQLLRKEVIQPHLPVRLPCYDFVPIASPTFTHSPPTNRVRPHVSGVADFHDVTGGVYKARERIHRGIADPRLLATPPSWGRVADPNPN